MLNPESMHHSARSDDTAPKQAPGGSMHPPAGPMHPPVYPLSGPMYYAIGQTPPYPGMYAVPDTNAPPGAQPPVFALVPPSGYAQQQNWGHPQLVHSSAPGPPFMTQNYNSARYVPTPLLSPVPSSGSPPALSPGTMSPPQDPEIVPLTPTTSPPTNSGTGQGSSTFTFKVRPYNQVPPSTDGKHFTQLVVEIFSTRPDDAAFSLVDAMITREFNAQRRRHEDNMETTELEKKDENGYYVCRMCGPEPPRYLHLKSLIRHTSTHFVTKPFACLFCDDRFTRTDVARKHLQSCRVLRTNLIRFGPERAAYIQRVISSAQRCMPGMTSHERQHLRLRA